MAMSDHRPAGGTGRHPDATELLRRLEAGDTTSSALVEEHLARIQADHPRINAAAEILAEEARSDARGPEPGPLSGLPVSVKEVFGMAGREVTVGSLTMPPRLCADDSAVVRRLRAAGAVIVARGNVPELSMAGETENPVFGRSSNPLDPARTCGGSSGGDAALVASGGAAAAIGSDILGSIRIPAAFCGLVGFKPSSAAVDKTGSWPEFAGAASDWLAAGPITRSVRDARLVYDVIADKPLPPPGNPRRGRLFVPDRFPMRFRDPVIGEALDAARRGLLDAGLAERRGPVADVKALYREKLVVLGTELAPLLKESLTDAGGRRFSVAAEWARRLAGRPRLYSGLLQLLTVAPALRRSSSRLVTACEEIRVARREVRGLLGPDGVLLLPTLGTLAPLHGRMNRLTLRPGFNPVVAPLTFCNYLDLPAITVPARRFATGGLVPGIMLVSAPGAEGLLLDVAAVLEGVLDGGDEPRG
jgi:Asp-tRNA(Asn)/Glu-tRNA(Gln) amidotransferase A subunit family amidase